MIIIISYVIVAYNILLKLHHESRHDAGSHFNNTTLLVMAHPDDETMFFGPTILNVVNSRGTLEILCLSTGDADSLGPTRERELNQVAAALGPLVKLSIISDHRLKDGFLDDWNMDTIQEYVENYLETHDNVKTLITFDDYGISGHPNHKSIHRSIMRMIRKLNGSRIKVLMLKSLSIWRKYTSFLDSIPTLILDLMDSQYGKNTIIRVLDFEGYATLKQTLELHSSQMVWFRQFYMLFSRYMFINELEYVSFAK